jgi:hypothetical protein
METELKIAILMSDRCTRKEAEAYLARGTEIYREDEVQDYIDNLKANPGCYDGETVEDLLAGEYTPDRQPIEFADKSYLIVYVD